MPQPPIVIVTAMSRQHQAIGMNNSLLWHVPADLQRFKELTLGHPIIMGRKTFESILAILGKPLPGRTNIVVTRDETYRYNTAKIAHSLEEAITIANEEQPAEIHIGGGAELYRQAIPLVSKLHVTWFDNEPEADTFFPSFLDEFIETAIYEPQTHEGVTFQWVDYVRE
ncbi:MAG: dihydrofolate reductase [Candidatus Nomurabacteria bacterium]|nr:MAG: dihydrofolate reductase [Candidatus Nomurabacteria bacterium]